MKWVKYEHSTELELNKQLYPLEPFLNVILENHPDNKNTRYLQYPEHIYVYRVQLCCSAKKKNRHAANEICIPI